MKSRQDDTIKTAQVRIDTKWRDILAHMRTDLHRPMRSLIEEALVEVYSDYQQGR